MELGQKLKEARLSAGLKQEELAKRLGVSRQTISNWENGRSLPDVGSAVKMSNVYQISLDELLKDESSVLKTFEDLVTKRRKFWQMMLEIGIILDILSTLLVVQEMEGVAIVCRIAGIALDTCRSSCTCGSLITSGEKSFGEPSVWFCTSAVMSFCALPCPLWVSASCG